MTRPARNLSTSSRRWTPQTRGGNSTDGPWPLGCSDPGELGSPGVPPTHSSVWWPRHPVYLELGQRRYDLTTRALVIGILNRTTDSFYDHRSEERRVAKERRSPWS